MLSCLMDVNAVQMQVSRLMSGLDCRSVPIDSLTQMHPHGLLVLMRQACPGREIECFNKQALAAVQGGLRQGIPNSGSAMPNPSSAPKTNKIASAVEKTNMAALRALDNSKLVPAGHARKLQTQPVRVNSSRAAVDTRYVPPAALKRPLSWPSTALRYGGFTSHVNTWSSLLESYCTENECVLYHIATVMKCCMSIAVRC